MAFVGRGIGPKLVVDAGIPFASDLDEDWYRVLRVEGEGWTAAAVRDADAICVRSTTRVGAGLLADSGLRFVGTVTSGTDHMDLPYLDERGIAAFHAPGSNAVAVAEYVMANLFALVPDLTERRPALGVVGYGNVGQAVARRARLFDLPVVVNDPPRAAADPTLDSRPLEEVLACPIVSLHVPLIHEGPFSTADLLDADRVAELSDNAVLFNAARGGIVDEPALTERLSRRECRAVVDCWAGEPVVDPALLRAAAVATPHIAGHTIDAKRRSARWLARALDATFDRPGATADAAATAEDAPPTAPDVDAETYGMLVREQLCFEAVSLQMKAPAGASAAARAASFRLLRHHAGMRQELGRQRASGWRSGTPLSDPHLPGAATRITAAARRPAAIDG